MMMAILGLPAFAESEGDLQQYLKDTGHRVNRTEVAAEKRANLNVKGSNICSIP